MLPKNDLDELLRFPLSLSLQPRNIDDKKVQNV